MKTPRKPKARNIEAVNAWRRSGAGKHRDRKREQKEKGLPDDQEK